MSQNKAIQIVLRIRPHQNYNSGIKIDTQNNQLVINLPKDQNQGYVNNQKQAVKFKFDQLFDQDAPQEKVFDRVAKEVVDSAVEGYNGTIFAYGQTGSGKTYTMTGDTYDNQKMGIIPRTLRYIYLLADLKGVQVKVVIRYMQIYNGVGYDLLDSSLDPKNAQKVKMLQDLKRVKPMQSSQGDLRLQNLSPHIARNYQQANKLLMVGDTNRVTCATLKNDQSTRSHCVFMINLQTSRPGSDVKNVASINLVDLSGSQKLKSTNYQQRVQNQAININLGLHYLQRLIVALNRKMNGQNVHVPYRQYIMNMVLRDSIGGNCITRMIATMSPKVQDVMQSISTCKFSQRVALIKNTIQRNQTVDPAIIINRLKRENDQLKAEIALLKGEESKEELDKWEIQDCHKRVDQYIETEDPGATIILGDRLKINQCFYYFKSMVKKGGKIVLGNKSGNLSQNSQSQSQGKQVSEADQNRYEDEIKKLKLALQSRQNQIALLLSLINKKRGGNALESLPMNRMKPEEQQMMKSVIKQKPMQFKKEQIQKQQTKSIISKTSLESKVQKNNWMNDNQSKAQTKSIASNAFSKKGVEHKEIQAMLIGPLDMTDEQMMDEAKAFDKFRISYRKNGAFQKNNQTLQEKYQKGKQQAANLLESRGKVAKLKQKLQELRRNNMVNNLVTGTESEDPQEEALKQQIYQAKQAYMQSSVRMKNYKAEIENIQTLQKSNYEQMKNDFLKYVKYKFQEREKKTAGVDSSIMASNVKDKQVQKHLQSFFKARDQLRKR